MGWCQVQHTGHTIPVTELGRHAIFTATMQVFSDAFQHREATLFNFALQR